MWIKLDDGFATHPKVIAAGAIPALLQVRAICYASQHHTDGFIPTEAVSLFRAGFELLGVDLAEVTGMTTMGCQADEIDWAPIMVKAGLWEVRDGGYAIHDYLEWNMSKKEYELFIKKKSRAGKKGMKARWKKDFREITSVITPAITDDITKPYHPTSTSTSTLSSLSSPNPEGEKIGKKRGNGGRPFPEEFQIQDKHKLLATQWRLDVGFEFGKFKNYCLAHNKHYANYIAAFRNWLATAYERQKGTRP